MAHQGYRADAIIVLGRTLDPGGRLSVLGRQRVHRAFQLWQEGVAPRLILTGRCSLTSTEPVAVTEAAAMAAHAVELGVPREALLLEERSRDTIGNAYFVQRDILDAHGWRSLRVVTSDFHIPRAAWVFQKVLGAGYDAAYSPSSSELFSTTVAARAREESDIATFLMDWFGDMADGDRSAMDRVVHEQHPGYAERPEITLEALQARMNEIAMVHRTTDTSVRGHRRRQVRVAEL